MKVRGFCQKEEKNVFMYQMLVKLMKHFVDVLMFIFSYVWCVLIGIRYVYFYMCTVSTYYRVVYIVYIFVNHSVIFNNGCISILFFLHTFSYYWQKKHKDMCMT